MVAPCAGIRVVELTSWMAAPSAAAILADLGADVVKVEPLTGDPVRGMIRQPDLPEGAPNIDYSFQVDNRGKRSIAVAIDRPEGADLVRRLVAEADVFLCNLLPHRQHRYGLDPESLLEVNARLVHATLTGYGMTGPDAHRPGYDVTAFFGRGAVAEAMREPGGMTPQPRPAQGDHTAGIALLAGVLAALRLVDCTGQGQVVDVSLLGVAAWTMSTDLAAALVDGRPISKRDRHHVLTPLAGRFRCGDDRWIMVNMPEARWWPMFCTTLDHAEWIDDERFVTPKTRYDNMSQLIDLIDAVLATEPMSHWAKIFDEAGLIWGPASSVDELARDPQAAAVGLFPEITHDGATFRTVATPFNLAGADVRPRGLAPNIGEHTLEVLQAVGIGLDQIATLAAEGVIGPVTLESK